MLNSYPIQSSIKQTQSQQFKKSTDLQSIHKLSLTSPIYDPELDFHRLKGSHQMKGSLCTTLSQLSHQKQEEQLYQQLKSQETELKKEKYLLTKQQHQEYQSLLKQLMELRRRSYARKAQIQQLTKGVAKAKKISLTINTKLG